MVICTSIATIYESPDYMSQQVDEMLYGEEAEILDEKDGFYKIISEYGYTGWTPKTNLFSQAKKPNYIVTAPFADLLPEGKYWFAPYMSLPRGAKVCVEFSENSPRYAYVNHPNENTFYIHKNQIAPIEPLNLSERELRNRLVETAKEYLGVTYRWGGRSHQGIDCSGLCFNAYRFNGLTVWRDADIDRSTLLRKITLDEIDVGDQLFFPGHVGMYVGDGKIIHSSASNGCVAIEVLEEKEWLRNNIKAIGTAF